MVRQTIRRKAWCLPVLMTALAASHPSVADEKDAVTTPHRVVEYAGFMPDGKRVLVGRNNGDIEVRSIPKGERLAKLHVPDELGSVAVSQDGRIIAASDGGDAKEVHVWDGVTLKPLDPIRVSGKKLVGIAFSPSSDLLAIGAYDDKPRTNDRTVVIWDVKKQEVRKLLHGESCAAKHLAFSPDGQVLACAAGGGGDRWVDVWYDPDNFHRSWFRGVQGNSHEVTCVAFMPNSGGPIGRGPRFATGGAVDNAIRFFQAYSELEFQTVRGHESSICALIPLAHEQIISGSLDHTIRVWDVAGGRELAVLRLDHEVICLNLSADRQTLVSVELSVREEWIRFWSVSKLLGSRGNANVQACEKWRGEWRPSPER